MTTLLYFPWKSKFLEVDKKNFMEIHPTAALEMYNRMEQVFITNISVNICQRTVFKS